uniref:Uncharacterized protein n=1 Tax=Compsopogon caeruleus TaxID=31354 RepID=A0A7S1TB92_9RHOD
MIEVKAWSEVIAEQLVRFQVVRLESVVWVWCGVGNVREVLDSSSLGSLGVSIPNRDGMEFEDGMPAATILLPGDGSELSQTISRRLCKRLARKQRGAANGSSESTGQVGESGTTRPRSNPVAVYASINLGPFASLLQTDIEERLIRTLDTM